MATAHIALVDDDKLVLALLGETLAGAGYTVSRFRSGEVALASLWSSQVDLLVVDLLLPGMSGFDLAQELRRRPQCRHLPVLAISALCWDDHRLAACRGVINSIIPKPVQPEALLAAARTLILASAANRGPVASPPPLPRREECVPAQLSVHLRSAAECVTEYTENLSKDGLFIRTYDPLPPDSAVEVDLTLPFLSEPVSLQGKVVRAVHLDSAEARTSGPGMGIALTNLSRELKQALKAYVTGVRDGIALQPSMPGNPTAVLLAGLDDRLPRHACTFLRRSGIHALRAARLGEALSVLQKARPQVVVVSAELLGDQPLDTLALLQHHGARSIAVVADAARGQALSGRAEVLDASASPAVLLDAISSRLSLSRRASARVRCIANVSTTRAEGRSEGVLENLSLGGLLMDMPEGFTVGERFVVEFYLPEQGGRVYGVARAVRVGRCGPGNGYVRVGVAFERLDDDSPEVLRRFVQTHLSEEALLRTGETPAPFRVPLGGSPTPSELHRPG